MKKDDRVTVIGPEGSAQLGKSGVVVEVNHVLAFVPPDRELIVVQLDGETRPRNFQPENLKKEGE